MAVEHYLVISDTHFMPWMLRYVMENEAGKTFVKVLHLGDLEEEDATIKAIAKCPLESVRGNNDFDYEKPSEMIVGIGNHKIFMTHGHLYGVDYSTEDLIASARKQGCDVALYGHTHRPVLKTYKDGFILANPGSLALPRQSGQYYNCSSYMIMEHDTVSDKLTFYKRYLKSV